MIPFVTVGSVFLCADFYLIFLTAADSTGEEKNHFFSEQHSLEIVLFLITGCEEICFSTS